MAHKPDEPTQSVSSKPISNRENNFNLLRLVLATLVILSHAPELKDGDRHREILSCIFHRLSFGDFGVDGFFILSGYLIFQSWNSEPNLAHYLIKRIGRIYPAYVVAVCLTSFIAGPLGAADAATYFSQINWLDLVELTVCLGIPVLPPTFVGTPYDHLVNGVIWTIGYEFVCYLLVVLFAPLFNRVRHSCLIVFVLVLALHFYDNWYAFPIEKTQHEMLRLFAFFLGGASFFYYRAVIPRSKLILGVCIFLCWLAMYQYATADLFLATCGAYVLFHLGKAPPIALQRWMGNCDPSYGVYLYAWPVQKILYWYCPWIDPWASAPIVFAVSLLFGIISWTFIEHPILRAIRRPKLVSAA